MKIYFHFSFNRLRSHEDHTVFHFLHGLILSGGFDLQWPYRLPHVYEQNPE